MSSAVAAAAAAAGGGKGGRKKMAGAAGGGAAAAAPASPNSNADQEGMGGRNQREADDAGGGGAAAVAAAASDSSAGGAAGEGMVIGMDEIDVEMKTSEVGPSFFDVRRAFKHPYNVRDLKEGPEFEELTLSLRRKGFTDSVGVPTVMHLTATVALQRGLITEAALQAMKERLLKDQANKWEDDVPTLSVVSYKAGKPYKQQAHVPPPYTAGQSNDVLQITFVIEGNHRYMATFRLFPTMLKERTLNPAKRSCALLSPYLPCRLMSSNVSDRLVQRASYSGNAAGHAVVPMDIHSQFTTIRNAIAIRMRTAGDKYRAAKTEAERLVAKPFDPFTKDGKLAVMKDLGVPQADSRIFTAHWDQYLAVVSWGAIQRAADAAALLYVDRVRSDESTAEIARALFNGAQPVPFEENPAMEILRQECRKGNKKSKLESKSLKHFTSGTLATGYVRGCLSFLLQCILANSPDGRGAIPLKSEQVFGFLALYHQHIKLPKLLADCLVELKDLGLPECDQLNSAEAGILRVLSDQLSYTSSTPGPAHDSIIKAATQELQGAINKLKSHPKTELTVEPIEAIELARTQIRQIRVVPVLAEQKKQALEEAHAKKLERQREFEAAEEKENEAKRAQAKAKAAEEAANKKAAEEEQAATAEEDAEKKHQAELAAAEAKLRAEAASQATKAATEAVASATSVVTAADKMKKVAEKEEEKADAALSELPAPLPPPSTVELGSLPAAKSKRKLKAKAVLVHQADEDIQALKEVAMIDVNAGEASEAGEEGEAGSGSSGVATTSVAGANVPLQRLDYLNRFFPIHQQDVHAWLKEKVAAVSDTRDAIARGTAQPEDAIPLYDFICLHPPGVRRDSDDYTDQPFGIAYLLEVVQHAASLLKPGATMAIHCTEEQRIHLMHVPVSLNSLESQYGCKWELTPLIWHFSSGEGGRLNNSDQLVSATHSIILMHKLDEKKNFIHNYEFSGFQRFTTAGAQSNLWKLGPRDQAAMLRLSKHTFGCALDSSRSKKESERDEFMPKDAAGIPTLDVRKLVKLDEDREEEGPNEGEDRDYVPSGKQKKASGTSNYGGDRSMRVTLRTSEIPQDVQEHLMQIFLLPASGDSYNGKIALDLCSGTQVTALVATRWAGLRVENVDFDPLVNMAARTRLCQCIGDDFEEPDESLGQGNFSKSILYRCRLDGLLLAEINELGANLGCELHRQLADFYLHMALHQANRKDIHPVCKCCGKTLVDLQRDATQLAQIQWITKPGIPITCKNQGFCSNECELFEPHVTLVSAKNTGGRVLRNTNNLLPASFFPLQEEEMNISLSAEKSALDAAMWQRVPEPRQDELDFDAREAVLRDEMMWGLEVVYHDRSDASACCVVPRTVRSRVPFAFGDVMGAITGELVEEGTADSNAALRPGRRPPIDITSTQWSRLSRDRMQSKVTARQWLVGTGLCASSWILPSDATHPANVTIAANYLVMSRYSRCTDSAIFPPGAISIIANTTINIGDELFYDARQIVTQPREVFSTDPVLTSDVHGGVVASAAAEEEAEDMDVDGAARAATAARAASSTDITFLQPWFAQGWPAQLKEQNKIPKRKAAAPKEKSLREKKAIFTEIEVDSDEDDEIKRKFKPRPFAKAKHRKTTARGGVPKELREVLFEPAIGRRHEMDIVDGVGYVPKEAEKAWFEHEDRKPVLALVARHNALLKRQWATQDSEAEFGLAPDEERNQFRIDQLLPEKMADYLDAVASGKEPNATRERLRCLPKVTLDELNVLKGHGADETTQEELQKALEDDPANRCLQHTYRSLIAEDVEKLNQFTLLKRKIFFDALLSSNSLRAFIVNATATQTTILPWVLCKVFLQHYCKILDALDTRVKAEGKLALRDSPSADNTVGARHWQAINQLVAPQNKVDKAQELPGDNHHWLKFVPKSSFILWPTTTELRPGGIVPGLFCEQGTSLLMPSKDLVNLGDAKIHEAAISANMWNAQVSSHRRLVLGPAPCPLVLYQTCSTKKTVDKTFADQWDQWDKGGRVGVEPAIAAGELEAIAVFEDFKTDREWRLQTLGTIKQTQSTSSMPSATDAAASGNEDLASDASSEPGAGQRGRSANARSKRALASKEGEEGEEGEEGRPFKKARNNSELESAAADDAAMDSPVAALADDADAGEDMEVE